MASGMRDAFRGMRSVTVLMNAGVDQIACVSRSRMGCPRHVSPPPGMRNPHRRTGEQSLNEGSTVQYMPGGKGSSIKIAQLRRLTLIVAASLRRTTARHRVRSYRRILVTERIRRQRFEFR